MLTLGILVSNIFQSNGACFETCKANYAFAVVQYKNCWCSDYIPAETASAGDCDEACPGFPSENCGSASAGLFGYIALSKSPSGTLGLAGSPSSSSSSTEAAESSAKVVSNISPGVALTNSFPSPRPAVPYTSTAAVLFLGNVLSSPKYISTAHVSSLTLFLTSFVQNSLPNSSPVTIQRTVTASPSVQISIISIVWFNPSYRARTVHDDV